MNLSIARLVVALAVAGCAAPLASAYHQVTVTLPTPATLQDYLNTRRLHERGEQALPGNQELWLVAGQFATYIAPQRIPEPYAKQIKRKGIADYFSPTLVKMREQSAGSNGMFGGDSITSEDNYPHKAAQTGTRTLTKRK